MSSTCPVCEAQQDAGLLCNNCCNRLEHDLGDVTSIVAELDVTRSRQAKMGASGKSGKGWAREKLPNPVGAIEAGDVLQNTLTTWARDVSGETWQPEVDKILVLRAKTQPFVGPFHDRCDHASCERMRLIIVDKALPLMQQVTLYLLGQISMIRRHPAVVELVDEITDAIRQARHAVDRPADRKFFGTCMAETPDEEGRAVTCLEEIWASPNAHEVTCRVCGVTHEIAERRAWLLQKAEDMICTIPYASELLGQVGHIRVTQASIRGYIHRKRLAYRPPVDAKMIRLGDLLSLLMDESDKAERKGVA